MDLMRIQSSPSRGMAWKYDVFVSFRGETRNNFTDHLFAALCRDGIHAFRDDTKLKKGEHISSELLQAIEGSQVLIVVFSKNYASSTWCLQELAKIADCNEVPGQSVLPIFYDVNPSEVRKQSGNYEQAFVEHEERFKDNLEKVQRWRGALTQVANLSGWDVRDMPEHAEIQKIIKEVTSILGHKFSSSENEIVGMHSRVEELEKLLVLGSDDVRVIGICGMGGIGKTTLATYLYEKISHLYDGSCFIDDVSKIYGDYGPIGATKQLLCQALREESLQIYNLSRATNMMQTRLRHVKALIVLDNVDQVEQLEKLAINRECLGLGSRIIIISRDEHILREHGVDDVYKVQLLNYDNALQLFCKKAFKCDGIMRDYKTLTDDVLNYANGLPLAIKVLGSFLFGRDVPEWRSALARLKGNPRKDIMDVLRISFDGLEDMEKEIFLDIACFFNGMSETHVKEILDIRGFHPDIGIRVLIDKSLITYNEGRIRMHGLLQDLGRNIVREKSPKEPRKWSRLWDYRDLHNVTLENKATNHIEAIIVVPYIIPQDVEEMSKKTWRAEALSQMSCLKLLVLHKVNFSGSLHFLSNELGYLDWENYPFTSFPSSFQPNKLVELILPHSNIKQLWEGTKCLYNLRRMDLCHSKNLIEMPNFGEAPNLEQLNLEGCIKLVRIDPSIGLLRKLIFLNLRNCESLVSIPTSLGEVLNLEWLNLEGCIKLVQIDPSIGLLRKLNWLNLGYCKSLVSIPTNIWDLSSLGFLNLSGCSKLFHNQFLEQPRHVEHLEKHDTSESTVQCQSISSIYKILMSPFHFFYSGRHKDSNYLLPSLPRLPSLVILSLCFCNLLQIPDAIGWLHSLKHLNLGGNNFITLPCSIKELSKLTYFNLDHCKQLKYLPELPSSTALPKREFYFHLEYAHLSIFNCPSLSEMGRCCSMAFSWMIRVIKANMQSSVPLLRVELVIPETQIPSWFKKQNVGSSISIDPYPIMHDNNWIGIACCATFVAHDDPTELGNVLGASILCGFRNERQGKAIYDGFPINLMKDLVIVESDHLLLRFFTREEFIDYFVNQIQEKECDLNGIELAFLINQPRGLHVEVKSCGYRWVFKEDLEQFEPAMMHSRNSPARKRKFLAIDDGSQL